MHAPGNSDIPGPESPKPDIPQTGTPKPDLPEPSAPQPDLPAPDAELPEMKPNVVAAMDYKAMAGITGARFTATSRLLVLARDLLQAADLRSVLELIGRAFQELLLADEALLLMNLAGQELDTAFDKAGFLHPPQKNGALYQRARQAMLEQTPIVQPHIAAIPLAPANVLASAESESVLALPFPPFEAVGVLAARWNREQGRPEVLEQMLVLRHLSELTGAAVGNVDLRLVLEAKIAACNEQIVEAAREHAQELQRRDRFEEEIRRLSDTDVLTGMLNRRGFFKYAEQSFKLARRQGLTGALLFADVDGLKAVNDEMGHEAGDRLIQDSAWILRNSFRDSDVIARFGGDEFAAFTLDTAQPDVILSRVQENVQSFQRDTPRPYRVSFSTGVVQCDPEADLGLSDYIGLADQEMYAHKRSRAA